MKNSRRHTLIPISHNNLEDWPDPDLKLHSLDPTFMARKKAVLMYADKISMDSIEEETRISAKEVRRLIRKCLCLHSDGRIAGFRALTKGFRSKEYERRSAVEHVVGGGKGGCAGALGLIFKKFPEVEALIQSLVFKTKGEFKVHEARIGYLEIHAEFKKKLEDLGVTEYDWPFNTENVGYNCLRNYCRGLLENDANAWIRARVGEEAARRSSVGNGRRSLLPKLRPYGAAQLDFHLVDAASTISITNRAGVDIQVPVARWYFGLLVEETFGLGIGVCIALELNPSGDSVLETIESAIKPMSFEEGDPRCVYVVDGKVLPNQMFSELSSQCFNVLKVDNAKCNSAAGVINNIIRTVGCVINFGPIRGWWRRDLVERIFGELTRIGLQRLPSTYGSNPKDSTRSRSPTQEAVKFKIHLNELVAIIYGCIRRHNITRSDALDKSSPIAALQAAMTHPASGFLKLPLPKEEAEDLRLLRHIEEVTVRGNLKKNERPYVNIGGERYTNYRLANSYDLLGENLLVYCDLRDARVVTASVNSTGEALGPLNPPRKWADVKISFRDRALINKAGKGHKLRENTLSPVREWVRDKCAELEKSHGQKSARKLRSSKEALALARIAPKLDDASPADSASLTVDNRLTESTSHSQLYQTSHHDRTVQQVPQRHTDSDPFGLRSAPYFNPVDKGE